jgi:hypothetical protein
MEVIKKIVQPYIDIREGHPLRNLELNPNYIYNSERGYQLHNNIIVIDTTHFVVYDDDSFKVYPFIMGYNRLAHYIEPGKKISAFVTSETGLEWTVFLAKDSELKKFQVFNLREPGKVNYHFRYQENEFISFFEFEGMKVELERGL